MTNNNIKIGLETHIKLDCNKKLFCNCKNIITKGNENICNICIGEPGALPVLNTNAIYLGIILSNILECELTDYIIFQRKHFAYKDMPKMYQITQENIPLGKNGKFYLHNKTINIAKLCIEEDAGQSIICDNNILVNDDKAGSPLIELTTFPDFETVDEVILYLKVLRDLCIKYGLVNETSSSSFRSDVNISVYNGPRIEMKNLNSINSIRDSIIFEIKRQKDLFNNNMPFCSETRSWDENKKISIFSRKKESINEYMFLPEFDIPVINIKDIIKKHQYIKKHNNSLKNFFLIEHKLDIERYNQLYKHCLNDDIEYTYLNNLTISQLKLMIDLLVNNIYFEYIDDLLLIEDALNKECISLEIIFSKYKQNDNIKDFIKNNSLIDLPEEILNEIILKLYDSETNKFKLLGKVINSIKDINICYKIKKHEIINSIEAINSLKKC